MPRTPVSKELAKSIDRELDWYFSYGESARRAGHVAFLPTPETRDVATVDESPVAILRRGLKLASSVEGALRTMPREHAGVLRAVFTPRHWPSAVVREFASLSAIAVRLTCAAHPWPARGNHVGLETAGAHHLADQLARKRARPAALKHTARALLRKAITAYIAARTAPAKGGSVAEHS